jgi:hypothetical protein
MIPIAEALGCQYATVEVDEQGIITSQFEKILENWDHSGSRPFPKVLYTIPVCQSPVLLLLDSQLNPSTSTAAIPQESRRVTREELKFSALHESTTS